MRTQFRPSFKGHNITMDFLTTILGLAMLGFFILLVARLKQGKDETTVTVSSTRTININIPVSQASTKARLCTRGDIKHLKSQSYREA